MTMPIHSADDLAFAARVGRSAAAVPVVERFFALRGIPLFAELPDDELLVVAEVAKPMLLSPGQVLLPRDAVSASLIVRMDGQLIDLDQQVLPDVVGLECLLLDAALASGVQAGVAGATCLLLRKGHFLTMLSECSGLARQLLRQRLAPGGAG